MNANKISDLTPLKDLNNLHWLYLNKNKISDISALAKLTNLEHLNLFNNQIGEDNINWLKQQLPKCDIETKESEDIPTG